MTERLHFKSVEQNANYRAFKYFNKNVDGFYLTKDQSTSINQNGHLSRWNFDGNPLDIYHKRYRGEYFDYFSKKDMELLKCLGVIRKH